MEEGGRERAEKEEGEEVESHREPAHACVAGLALKTL